MIRSDNPLTPPSTQSTPPLRPAPAPATWQSGVTPTAPSPEALEAREARFKAQLRSPTPTTGVDLQATQQTLESGIDQASPERIEARAQAVPRPSALPEGMGTELAAVAAARDGLQDGRAETRARMQGVLRDLPPAAAPPPPTTRPRAGAQDSASLSAQRHAPPAVPASLAHLEARDAARLDATREQVASARAHDRAALTQTELTPRVVPLAEEFNSASLLVPPSKPVSISAVIAGSFATMERDLRPTVLMPGKQDAILAKARKEAMRIASTARPESDMLFKLATMPPAQLRDEVARSVGGMRADRYGEGTDYQNLSPKKKALVDAIIRGFQEGMASQSHEVGQAISGRMSTALRTQLAAAPAESDLVFALTLKSKAEIMGELGLKMGLVTPERLKKLNADAELDQNPAMAMNWLNDLNPAQKAMIESMATSLHQVLNESLPNKPSRELAAFDTDQGRKQAPTTITLNGRTYSEPTLLGTGGLGLILKYTDKQTGESVVIKSLLKMHERSDMVKELQAHRHVMGGAGGAGHENVIGMRGVVRGNDDSLYMVMDMARGGDLSRVSSGLNHAARSGALPIPARLALIQAFSQGAISGMQHMQERNMMHLDVKALNFLLDESGTVMLSDFGSGQRTSELGAERAFIPTTYAAPEWGSGVSQKSDIFQFAMTMRDMLGEQDLREAPSAHRGAAADFINAMLDPDPSKRPTLDALASSSFVRDVEGQDPDKMKALLTAAVAYGKAVGKEVEEIGLDIEDVTKKLQKAESLLATADPVSKPEAYQTMMANVAIFTEQLAALQAKLAAVNNRPEVRPLLAALTRAGEGIV